MVVPRFVGAQTWAELQIQSSEIPFRGRLESEDKMFNWQFIFLPQFVVVGVWLLLCHLQIGPTDRSL
jgi:hypothetical protein